MPRLFIVDDGFGCGGIIVDENDYIIDAPPYYRHLISKQLQKWLKVKPSYIKVTEIKEED